MHTSRGFNYIGVIIIVIILFVVGIALGGFLQNRQLDSRVPDQPESDITEEVEQESETADPPTQEPAPEEGIVITSPQPNEKINFPVTVSGYINGNGWLAGEGEVGTVEIFDANDVLVSDAVVLFASGEWRVLPTDFVGEVGDGVAIDDIQTDAGYLVFTNRAVADTDPILTYRVPVVFSNSIAE